MAYFVALLIRQIILRMHKSTPSSQTVNHIFQYWYHILPNGFLEFLLLLLCIDAEN
jgi:hypothetical protein